MGVSNDQRLCRGRNVSLQSGHESIPLDGGRLNRKRMRKHAAFRMQARTGRLRRVDGVGVCRFLQVLEVAGEVGGKSPPLSVRPSRDGSRHEDSGRAVRSAREERSAASVSSDQAPRPARVTRPAQPATRPMLPQRFA